MSEPPAQPTLQTHELLDVLENRLNRTSALDLRAAWKPFAQRTRPVVSLGKRAHEEAQTIVSTLIYDGLNRFPLLVGDDEQWDELPDSGDALEYGVTAFGPRSNLKYYTFVNKEQQTAIFVESLVHVPQSLGQAFVNETFGQAESMQNTYYINEKTSDGLTRKLLYMGLETVEDDLGWRWSNDTQLYDKSHRVFTVPLTSGMGCRTIEELLRTTRETRTETLWLESDITHEIYILLGRGYTHYLEDGDPANADAVSNIRTGLQCLSDTVYEFSSWPGVGKNFVLSTYSADADLPPDDDDNELYGPDLAELLNQADELDIDVLPGGRFKIRQSGASISKSVAGAIAARNDKRIYFDGCTAYPDIYRERV